MLKESEKIIRKNIINCLKEEAFPKLITLLKRHEKEKIKINEVLFFDYNGNLKFFRTQYDATNFNNEPIFLREFHYMKIELEEIDLYDILGILDFINEKIDSLLKQEEKILNLIKNVNEKKIEFNQENKSILLELK